MTITTTAPTIDESGITAPTYAEILDYLQTQYRSIFGADVYLEDDSQDGQLLAIFAKSVHDANNAAVAQYNARSPATAKGNGLSNLVKINGITRLVPTNSTANIAVVGVAGTAITNGVVEDANGTRWALPASVSIPDAGTITVTATCATAGAVAAIAGTITKIITPQLGWQSATNPDDAVLGAPVESDATLRKRQATSVAQPGQTPLETVAGAVAKVAGVTRYTAYENPTNSTDSNGIPAHSIALVVEGGSLSDIAYAIANKKTVGTGTYGTTSQTVLTAYGVPQTIDFYVVTEKRTTVAIDLEPINGYTSAIGDKIKAAIADYINALPIGDPVRWTRLFTPANLSGDPDGMTYEITSLAIAAYPDSPASADVPVEFYKAAHCDVADITINLV